MFSPNERYSAKDGQTCVHSIKSLLTKWHLKLTFSARTLLQDQTFEHYVGILSWASSFKYYYTIYLHGRSQSEQLVNSTVQLKVLKKYWNINTASVPLLHHSSFWTRCLVQLSADIERETGVDRYYRTWLVLRCKASHFRIVHLKLEAQLTRSWNRPIWCVLYRSFVRNETATAADK